MIFGESLGRGADDLRVAQCANILRRKGLPAPMTCDICQLGPCHHMASIIEKEGAKPVDFSTAFEIVYIRACVDARKEQGRYSEAAKAVAKALDEAYPAEASRVHEKWGG